MSPVHEQSGYIRPVFDESRPIKPGCPLCWDNGLLKGGYVLAESEFLFVYVFVSDDGTLTDNFIAPKEHHPDMTTLPAIWGVEFGRCYAQLRDAFNIEQHAGYWNEGFAAGQRVPGHWHVRIDEAPAENAPSYGMGLSLLRRTFDGSNI